MDDGHLFKDYGPVAGYDEMFDVSNDTVRETYLGVSAKFEAMGATDVRHRAEALASAYLDQGVTFGVAGEERPFPLDIVPRLIEAE